MYYYLSGSTTNTPVVFSTDGFRVADPVTQVRRPVGGARARPTGRRTSRALMTTPVGPSGVGRRD